MKRTAIGVGAGIILAVVLILAASLDSSDSFAQTLNPCSIVHVFVGSRFELRANASPATVARAYNEHGRGSGDKLRHLGGDVYVEEGLHVIAIEGCGRK